VLDRPCNGNGSLIGTEKMTPTNQFSQLSLIANSITNTPEPVKSLDEIFTSRNESIYTFKSSCKPTSGEKEPQRNERKVRVQEIISKRKQEIHDTIDGTLDEINLGYFTNSNSKKCKKMVKTQNSVPTIPLESGLQNFAHTSPLPLKNQLKTPTSKVKRTLSPSPSSSNMRKKQSKHSQNVNQIPSYRSPTIGLPLPFR
jgi:hypothetical protein